MVFHCANIQICLTVTTLIVIQTVSIGATLNNAAMVIIIPLFWYTNTHISSGYRHRNHQVIRYE